MRLRKGPSLLSLLGLTLALQAQGTQPNLQFSGFGTLGAVATGTHQVAFGRDWTEFDHATDHPDAALDSRLGLQLSSRLTDNLLWTFQVLAKNQWDDTFRPQVEWACLTWTPSPAWVLKGGRIGLEALPNGDFATVGYTLLWVRPPVEVFGGSEVSFLDGVDVTRSFDRPDGTNIQLQVVAGFGDEKVAVNNPQAPFLDLTGSSIWAVALKVRKGALRSKFSYTEVKFVKEYGGAAAETFRDTLASFSTFLNDPRPAQVAAATRLKGTVGRQFLLGASWEKDRFQAQGALVRALFHHLGQPSSWGGFGSVGYRFGQVVPYALWSRAVSDRNPPPDLGPMRNLPGPLAPALVQTVDAAASGGDVDQTTYSAGLRWDFADQAALKVQVDRVHSHNSTGFWWVKEPGWDGRATVMTVTLDFIFGTVR